MFKDLVVREENVKFYKKLLERFIIEKVNKNNYSKYFVLNI